MWRTHGGFILLAHPHPFHARHPQVPWTLDVPGHPPSTDSAGAGWMLREGKQGGLCSGCCGGMSGCGVCSHGKALPSQSCCPWLCLPPRLQHSAPLSWLCTHIPSAGSLLSHGKKAELAAATSSPGLLPSLKPALRCKSATGMVTCTPCVTVPMRPAHKPHPRRGRLFLLLPYFFLQQLGTRGSFHLSALSWRF